MRASEILSRAGSAQALTRASVQTAHRPVQGPNMPDSTAATPRIPPALDRGSIYRQLMQKHDRFSPRHVVT